MNEKKKSLGYKIGYGFGLIVCSCISIMMIAGTIKFLMWLF